MPPCTGYENAAKVAKLAHAEDITLEAATVRLGLLTTEQFRTLVVPENMIVPHSVRDTDQVR